MRSRALSTSLPISSMASDTRRSPHPGQNVVEAHVSQDWHLSIGAVSVAWNGCPHRPQNFPLGTTVAHGVQITMPLSRAM